MIAEQSRCPNYRSILLVALSFASCNTLFILWVYSSQLSIDLPASKHSSSVAFALDNDPIDYGIDGDALHGDHQLLPETNSVLSFLPQNIHQARLSDGRGDISTRIASSVTTKTQSNRNHIDQADSAAHLPRWIRDYIDFHGRPNTAETRYLVWICDQAMPCGGIGDRARGIVSSFYLALVTGRKLLIKNADPVSITEILVPASFDWSSNATTFAAEAEWEYRSIDHINEAFLDLVQGQAQHHRVVSVRTNYIIWPIIMNDSRLNEARRQRQIPNGDSSSEWNEMLFNWSWKALMSPSVALLQDIAALRRHTGIADTDFLAVHIRRGGHWGDPFRYHDANLLAAFAACLQNVTTVIGVAYPVYVTSDDVATKDKFAHLVVPLQVVYDNATIPFHVERTERQDGFMERNRRAWAEYYLLSMSRCAVVCGSGFSIWPVAMSRHVRDGSRCFARFERCSVQAVERSVRGFVPVRI